MKGYLGAGLSELCRDLRDQGIDPVTFDKAEFKEILEALYVEDDLFHVLGMLPFAHVGVDIAGIFVKTTTPETDDHYKIRLRRRLWYAHMFVTMVMFLWEIEVREETAASQKPERLAREARQLQKTGKSTLRKTRWDGEWASHLMREFWESRDDQKDPELRLGTFADVPVPRGGVGHTGGTAVVRKTNSKRKR